MTYRLLGGDGRAYRSAAPGTLGGNRRGRLYGRLDCPAALRAIARGGYVEHRVFFADGPTAVQAGYRPCAVCLPSEYDAWRKTRSGTRDIAPGAVHLPDWLSVEQQRELVDVCRGWARGPVPIRSATLPGGHVMSVRTVCLGWHWQPYRYTRTAEDAGGGTVAPFPDWLADLGRRALAGAYGDPAAGAGYRPDTALINHYDDGARLGMHQDRDERSDEPVVSLSIGDTCLFRFGNTETRTRPYTDVELASGDLFVFGGPSRFAYHGVPKVFPGTADPRTGLSTGRLNITMRVTGLS